MNKLQNIVIGIGLSCASLAIFFVISEVAVRAYKALKPAADSGAITPDARYGWRTTPGYSFDGNRKDLAGNSNPVRVFTDENGFREYADPNAEGFRIFFIGDSFTFAKDVDQKDTFYRRVGELLDAQIFAYGADGFCTTQEFLLLDEYLDVIDPDLVVWQFCWNDIIGVSLELTRGSAINLNGVDQPFMRADGSIEYRNPHHGPLMRSLGGIPSAFLHSVLNRADNIVGRPTLDDTIEKAIESKGDGFAPCVDATRILDRVTAAIKNRCGAVPIVSFNVDELEPYHSAFRSTAEKNGIPFLESIPETIRAAEIEGANLFAADGAHWTAGAHALCAEVLAEYIRENYTDSGVLLNNR